MLYRLLLLPSRKRSHLLDWYSGGSKMSGQFTYRAFQKKSSEIFIRKCSLLYNREKKILPPTRRKGINMFNIWLKIPINTCRIIASHCLERKAKKNWEIFRTQVCSYYALGRPWSRLALNSLGKFRNFMILHSLDRGHPAFKLFFSVNLMQ